MALSSHASLSLGVTNIASALPEYARRQPQQLAVIFPAGRDQAGRVAYTTLTFKQLDQESDRLAYALQQVGLERGMRTVLMVRPSLEFFALTFALFKLGTVPVFVDPGMGVRSLATCLAEAEPTAFIGIPKAHLARLLFGWARRSLKLLVTVGRYRFWGGYRLEVLRNQLRETRPFPVAQPTQVEEPAAILFTSGSTGVPKGAVYTHEIFNAQVRLLRTTYRIEPGEIDLATFPLFALFGPALGMTAVVPDMDATKPAQVEPRKIIEAIENFGVTNMFGSPALLKRVGEFGASLGITLPSLRRVISAGAPVHAPVLETFTKLLSPGVQIFTPYGATEALPVASLGSAEILYETRQQTEQGLGVCVGRPVTSMQVRIIKIDDGPIAVWSPTLLTKPGEIGEIAVQGPVVTRSYFRRPEATNLAKIIDLEQGTFWHRMGDVGYFDEQGRLWFCGRKTQRVETAQGTLYTIPCEGIFNKHPAVQRSALVGVGPKGQAQPVICIERKPGEKSSEAELKQELLQLAQRHEPTKSIKQVLFHSAFPVDIRHNAKIFREKLAVWAERKVGQVGQAGA